MRPSRLFTVEEANAEVPRLMMLLERLQLCALRLDDERRAAAAARGLPVSSISSEDLVRRRPAARALIEELTGVVQEIERSGAVLKDIELGLVDFPCEMDGEPALLCWQFGELTVGFWHRDDEGFAARRALTGVADGRDPPVGCMARYRAVLLDLFGTLILAEPARLPEVRIGDATVRSTLGGLGGLLARYAPGVRPDQFWHALAAVSEEMGARQRREHVEEPSRERFRRALARVGCDARACEHGGAALARSHHRALGDATVLPPEHATLLAEWRTTHRLAVVSNFDDTASAYDILHRHGILGLVHAVVVSESLGLRKPHPLMVETALHALDVPGDQAVLVGDTFAEDVGAAHAAGIDAAWIDRAGAGVPAGAARPRFVVRTLAEMQPLLVG